MGAKDTTDQPEEPGVGLIDQWLARHNEPEPATAEPAGTGAPEAVAATPERPAPRAPIEEMPPVPSVKDRLAAARRAVAGQATDDDPSAFQSLSRQARHEPPARVEPVAPRRFDLAAAREQAAREQARDAEPTRAALPSGRDEHTPVDLPPSPSPVAPEGATASSTAPERTTPPVGSARERLAAQRGLRGNSRDLAAEVFGAANAGRAAEPEADAGEPVGAPPSQAPVAEAPAVEDAGEVEVAEVAEPEVTERATTEPETTEPETTESTLEPAVASDEEAPAKGGLAARLRAARATAPDEHPASAPPGAAGSLADLIASVEVHDAAGLPSDVDGTVEVGPAAARTPAAAEAESGTLDATDLVPGAPAAGADRTAEDDTGELDQPAATSPTTGTTGLDADAPSEAAVSVDEVGGDDLAARIAGASRPATLSADLGQEEAGDGAAVEVGLAARLRAARSGAPSHAVAPVAAPLPSDVDAPTDSPESPRPDRPEDLVAVEPQDAPVHAAPAEAGEAEVVAAAPGADLTAAPTAPVDDEPTAVVTGSEAEPQVSTPTEAESAAAAEAPTEDELEARIAGVIRPKVEPAHAAEPAPADDATESAEAHAERKRNGKHKAEAAEPEPSARSVAEEPALDTAVMEPALQAVLRAVESPEPEKPRKGLFRRGKVAREIERDESTSLRPPVTDIPEDDDPALLLDPTVARGLTGDDRPEPRGRDTSKPRAGVSGPARAVPAPGSEAPAAPLDPIAALRKATEEQGPGRLAATATPAVPPALDPDVAPPNPLDPMAAVIRATSATPRTKPTPPPALDTNAIVDPPVAVPPTSEDEDQPGQPHNRPRTMAARAKEEARRAEAARAAILAEVAGTEPEETSSPVPHRTELPRGVVPELVKFSPRRSTRQLLGVLLFIALVGTIGTGFLAVDSKGTAEIAIAATMGLLTLILWSAFSTSEPAKVSIQRGVLDVVAKETHYRFDLASPYTEVTVKGAPGKRSWQVQIARRNMAPYVIDSSMVDPHEFQPILDHYRAEAERHAAEASRRRSRSW